MKKILITGATGFLGSYLAKELVNQGCQVIVLKRPKSDIRRIESILPEISTYDTDGLDLSKPFKDHGRIDAVIHAATCYGRNNENISGIFETNTVFPLRLLETAAFFNTGTFFNTDTILQKHLNGYALSKKHFMEWGKQFASLGRIRFVNIRLEHMYGPDDHDSKFTTHVIRSCLANVPELKLTLGEQKRDFIYIDDVVSAYNTLLSNAEHQPEMFQEYDVGTGKAVSICEFVKMVHKITRSATHLNFGALPYRENEVMQSEADIAPLKSLGWSYRVGLAEGIKRVVQGESHE